MLRSRYTSEEVFQDEIDRLQVERTRLLRERNLGEIPYRAEESHRLQGTSSQRDSWQHPTYPSTAAVPGKRDVHKVMPKAPMVQDVQSVKSVLSDIMKGSQNHGADHQTSMRYLKDIQEKLGREVSVVTLENRRTSQTDSLIDLKSFIDRLIQSNEHISKRESGRKSKNTEKFKRSLEKISEDNSPSANASSQSELVSSSNNDGVSSSKSSGDCSSESAMHETTKKGSGGDVKGVLEGLEHKIFKEVSVLRDQNARLRIQLEVGQKSPGKRFRKDSGENQTIINQLVRNDPNNVDIENRLRNKVRMLEMELSNLTKGGPHRVEGSRLLEQKDNEINHLRKEVQGLISHLQRNKHQVESLRRQVVQLEERASQKAAHEQQLILTIRNMESQIGRLRSQGSRGNHFRQVLPRYHVNSQKPSNHHYHQQTLNRKASDLPKRSTQGETIQRHQDYQGGNTHGTRMEKDKLGEYRDVLASLRAMRK